MTAVAADPALAGDVARLLEQHRAAITAQCRWMLRSAAEADDAVQETMVRAWQAHGAFEGRGSLLAWLRRIARNVCLDMLRAGQRRPVPAEHDPWDTAESDRVPGGPGGPAAPAGDDPAERAVAGDDVRRAFVAALLHLSPRERSALLLCEVLRWRAAEVAELLGTSVAAVNSALQRARAAAAGGLGPAAPAGPGGLDGPAGPLDAEQRVRLAGYVAAFQRHDVDGLVALVRRHDGAAVTGAAVTGARPG